MGLEKACAAGSCSLQVPNRKHGQVGVWRAAVTARRLALVRRKVDFVAVAQLEHFLLALLVVTCLELAPDACAQQQKARGAAEPRRGARGQRTDLAVGAQGAEGGARRAAAQLSYGNSNKLAQHGIKGV